MNINDRCEFYKKNLIFLHVKVTLLFWLHAYKNVSFVKFIGVYIINSIICSRLKYKISLLKLKNVLLTLEFSASLVKRLMFSYALAR